MLSLALHTFKQNERQTSIQKPLFSKRLKFEKFDKNYIFSKYFAFYDTRGYSKKGSVILISNNRTASIHINFNQERREQEEIKRSKNILPKGRKMKTTENIFVKLYKI